MVLIDSSNFTVSILSEIAKAARVVGITMPDSNIVIGVSNISTRAKSIV